MSDIQVGFCQCGCGEKTNIATRSQSNRGYIKGNPKRYIFGHEAKSRQVKDRKRVTHNGKQTRLYRKIVEDILGYPLPLNAVVHHVDGNIKNNEKNNLVVCQNHAYHRMIHARATALKECGHPHWRKCKYCHKYDDPNNLYIPKSSKYAMHRDCNAKYHRIRRQRIKNANNP